MPQLSVNSKHCQQETADEDQQRPRPKRKMDPFGVYETCDRNTRHRQAPREPSFPFRYDLVGEVLHEHDALDLQPCFQCGHVAHIPRFRLSSCFLVSLFRLRGELILLTFHRDYWVHSGTLRISTTILRPSSFHSGKPLQFRHKLDNLCQSVWSSFFSSNRCKQAFRLSVTAGYTGCRRRFRSVAKEDSNGIRQDRTYGSHSGDGTRQNRTYRSSCCLRLLT